jgi:hypothetical protein
MKSFSTKIICGLLTFLSCFFFAYGAEITIQSSTMALANAQPIEVQIFLNPEEDTLSGISGSFSFPEDMFSIEDIVVESSVVSLWVKQPAISNEKYLDSRTHITFEGIFPGGYEGVRSPYYGGKKPGILFSVILVPKLKGMGAFIVDDVVLHRFDGEASLIDVPSVFRLISVPDLNVTKTVSSSLVHRIKSPTLTAAITRDSLISNNAWYLFINESKPVSGIESVYVAETDDYNGEIVEPSSWRKVTMPYVLLYQDRSKFVNVKIVYANRTYTTITLPPVENSNSISLISRILVSIVIVLCVIYAYATQRINSLQNKK